MVPTLVKNIRKRLQEFANKERSKTNAWFFKTGPGEYGEGDTFIGVSVPQIRLVAKEFHNASLEVIEDLLRSSIHEERLLAIILLVSLYKKSNDQHREQLFNFYIEHTRFINNWDFVDVSAEYIVGQTLDGKGTTILKKLAQSSNIWERRIAMIATFYYIKQRRHLEAFEIAEILLKDTHDLIHKAVGWMLREVGKRCGEEVEEIFLQKNYKVMPRTMLRYAIERFPERKRNYYMKK